MSKRRKKSSGCGYLIGLFLIILVMIAAILIFLVPHSNSEGEIGKSDSEFRSTVDEDDEKNAEMTVAMNSLRLYKELGLRGGLLRVNQEVVAFTMGEPVCDDTIVVHIEKARTDIEGAYSMINQQFVIHETEGYTYINREDDVGEEGLRKAKLSYHPVFMVEKGTVRFKK